MWALPRTVPELCPAHARRERAEPVLGQLDLSDLLQLAGGSGPHDYYPWSSSSQPGKYTVQESLGRGGDAGNEDERSSEKWLAQNHVAQEQCPARDGRGLLPKYRCQEPADTCFVFQVTHLGLQVWPRTSWRLGISSRTPEFAK